MSFKLKSGNSIPFKQMGSSPFKQTIGGGAGEALTHWEKFKKGAKTVVKKGKKVAKKVVKTGVKRNPYVTVASMLFGKSASATQPGTGKHGGTKTKTYDPKTGTYK